MSEILVGAVEPAAHGLGLSNVFVGVFIVAILGNAAEHATAVTVAMKNRMDLSLSIAIGSGVQVALFVAPLLVLVSLFVGPKPMDLIFSGGLVLSMLLAVLITGQIAGDGRSDWLKGVQLLAVYLILGLTYFVIPDTPAGLRQAEFANHSRMHLRKSWKTCALLASRSRSRGRPARRAPTKTLAT